MTPNPKDQTTWPLPPNTRAPVSLFNKHKRRNIVSALKGCKKHLWDGKNDVPNGAEVYICYALIKSGRVASETVQEIIHARLDDQCTVWLWLNATFCNYSQTLVAEQVQAYRLRWVNSLIEEFSA